MATEKSTKIESLDKFLSMMDKDALTKEDFLMAVKRMMALIDQIQKETLQAVEKILQTHGTLLGQARDEQTKANSDIKGQVNELFVGNRLNEISSKNDFTLTEMRQIIDDKLSTIRSGDDGITPSKEDLINLIIPLIPKAKDGKNVEESLINKIREEVKDLDKRTKKAFNNQGKVQTPRYVHTPMVDVFTGDGSKKAFTLSKAPKSLDTIDASSSDFPMIYANGAGFTVAGRVLTLDNTVDALSLDARMVVRFYI